MRHPFIFSTPSGCGEITGMRSLASSPGVPASTRKAEMPLASRLPGPRSRPSLRAKIT